MSKKILSSLDIEDFEVLSDLATHLLSLKAKKSSHRNHVPFCTQYPELYICTEPVVFTIEELRVLKKFKHLHLLEYEKNV